MKNKGLILCLLCLLLWGCAAPERAEEATDTTVWLNMGLTFPVVESLPEGQGQSVKVVLLLGQSNATGCSLTSYLQQNVQPEAYAAFQAGYDNVRINFCMDDHKYTTQGAFVPVALDCGAGQGYFGRSWGYSSAGRALEWHSKRSAVRSHFNLVGKYSIGADKQIYDLICNNGDIIYGTFCGHVHGDFYTEIHAKTAAGEEIMIPQYMIQGTVYDRGHFLKITVE